MTTDASPPGAAVMLGGLRVGGCAVRGRRDPERTPPVTSWRIIEGDCRQVLATLPDQSVQTVVTSPPYFGLRDYGTDGQIGLEATPDEFVQALVAVFREVRRVLRDDGTVWCNLGDSFGAGKQLLGVAWRFAFAMQRHGWVLRSDIVWSKSNPMPESVADRPTKAHEFVFLLSKQPRYYWDADAIREPLGEWSQRALESDWGRRTAQGRTSDARNGLRSNGNGYGDALNPAGRNKRSVWTVAIQGFAGAHFATMPPRLVEPCILAGSREGDTVLDPFAGSGTTCRVAISLGRQALGIDLNPEYATMASRRAA